MRSTLSTLIISLSVFLYSNPLISRAMELDYPLTPITEHVQVIYGPLDLPNAHNQGFRNNVVIVQTSAGVVVFDPGGSASAGEMVVRKIKTLTNQPVVAVFDSHAHGDHWLGNEAIKVNYPNAVIYGHKTAKLKITGSDGIRWLELINKVTDGTAKGTIPIGPDLVVKDGDVITIGDTQFRIYHIGKAHTDNDIMIEIVGKDIIFTGDIIRNGMFGVMEEDSSFKGNVAAINVLLEKNFGLVIPGHGKAGGPEIAKNYQNYLLTVYGEVEQLYAQGIADFEMKKKIMPKLSAYESWSGFDMRVGPHISRAFLEVENEAF